MGVQLVFLFLGSLVWPIVAIGYFPGIGTDVKGRNLLELHARTIFWAFPWATILLLGALTSQKLLVIGEISTVFSLLLCLVGAYIVPCLLYVAGFLLECLAYDFLRIPEWLNIDFILEYVGHVFFLGILFGIIAELVRHILHL